MMVRGVALVVRDLERVAAFYRVVIGLETLVSVPGRVVLGAGGVALLELLHRPDARAHDAREAGLFHTAFLLPSRADLGRWLAHASAIGQGLDGAADHMVSEAVYLRDPEGNGIEVYADRPAETWSWTETAEGRRIRMANARLDLVALAALAQRPWDAAPPGTRIGHVHLQGGDIAQATAFYAGPAGLDVTVAWPEAVFLSTGGYHHHLAVNVWNSAGAGMRDPDRAGLAWVMLDGQRPDLTDPTLTDPWGTVIRFDSTTKEGLPL